MHSSEYPSECLCCGCCCCCLRVKREMKRRRYSATATASASEAQRTTRVASRRMRQLLRTHHPVLSLVATSRCSTWISLAVCSCCASLAAPRRSCRVSTVALSLCDVDSNAERRVATATATRAPPPPQASASKTQRPLCL